MGTRRGYPAKRDRSQKPRRKRQIEPPALPDCEDGSPRTEATVSRIAPSARFREHANIYLEGEFWMMVRLTILQEERLRVGSCLPASTYASIGRREIIGRATESALTLLAARARSRGEIEQRLRQHGYPPAVIEAAVGRIGELGYLDDEAFALAFARSRVRTRPKGASTIARELARKGVNANAASAAIAAAFEAEGQTEADLAHTAAAKWARTRGTRVTDPRKRREKLYAYLAGRGFRGDALRAGMEAAETTSPDGTGRSHARTRQA